jgi:AcrR family transcriptional regulator
MAPDDRREMLVAATLPLVVVHGPKVTTRQIADAAGVAEGTIFRVFPDKEALIQAAVARALDTAPVLGELSAIDPGLPLRERLTVITAVLQRRFRLVFDLTIALGRYGGPPDHFEEHRNAVRTRHELILAEIAHLLRPYADQFRWPVSEVVRVLRLLTFSGSHPLIADGRLLSPEEITEVLLCGTLHHDHHAPRGHQC